MTAIVIELPEFERDGDHLDDDGVRELQRALMTNPVAGDLIEGTSGLPKLRIGDCGRSKLSGAACG